MVEGTVQGASIHSVDPKGSENGDRHVFRGGCWSDGILKTAGRLTVIISSPAASIVTWNFVFQGPYNGLYGDHIVCIVCFSNHKEI